MKAQIKIYYNIFLFNLSNSWEYFKVKKPRDDKAKDHAGQKKMHYAAAMPDSSSLH